MWNPCPRCHETIQPFASKCPHCLSDLDEGDSDTSVGFFGMVISVVFWVFLIIMLAGCNTLGGTISGMGKDLSKAGDWISSK